MGLQGQLSDLSSDSIPLLLFAMFATFMGRLRSSVSSFLHSLGLPRRLDRPPPEEEGLFASALGSGLASLQLLAEQLNLNHCFSYRYDRTRRHRDVDAAVSDDCVVCLSTLKDGEDVRMLECRHVFHKECFDGWLDQLNFSCPICRFPLVKEERVEETRRQVGYDLLNWFSLRAN